MHTYVFYRRWYATLNGTIANAALRELDPHFQGQAFSTLISEMVRASVQTRAMTL